MRQVCMWLGVGLALLSAESGGEARQTSTTAARRSQARVSTPAADISSQRAILNQYCVTCHNERARTGGLALDTLDPAHVSEAAETWEKVVRKLRGGMMPPQGMPRPDAAVLESFTAWLETSLDR